MSSEPPSVAPDREPPPAEVPSPSGIAVIIPARDEEESLPGLLEALQRGDVADGAERPAPVVVVDNGSTDRTATVARAGGAIVVHEPRMGYGAACLAGIEYLRTCAPHVAGILFLDADQGTIGPLLGPLTEPILRGEADMVLGVRVGPGGGGDTMPGHQRFGNRLILGLVSRVFGWRLADLPPLRAVGSGALASLEMDDQDWGWTLQMQLRARSHGLRIQEVEVPHRSRERGDSKISGSLRTSLRVGWTMVRTILSERRRHLDRSGAGRPSA